MQPIMQQAEQTHLQIEQKCQVCKSQKTQFINLPKQKVKNSRQFQLFCLGCLKDLINKQNITKSDSLFLLSDKNPCHMYINSCQNQIQKKIIQKALRSTQRVRRNVDCLNSKEYISKIKEIRNQSIKGIDLLQQRFIQASQKWKQQINEQFEKIQLTFEQNYLGQILISIGNQANSSDFNRSKKESGVEAKIGLETDPPLHQLQLLSQSSQHDFGHLPFLMNSLTHFDKLLSSLLQIQRKTQQQKLLTMNKKITSYKNGIAEKYQQFVQEQRKKNNYHNLQSMINDAIKKQKQIHMRLNCGRQQTGKDNGESSQLNKQKLIQANQQKQLRLKAKAIFSQFVKLCVQNKTTTQNHTQGKQKYSNPNMAKTEQQQQSTLGQLGQQLQLQVNWQNYIKFKRLVKKAETLSLLPQFNQKLFNSLKKLTISFGQVFQPKQLKEILIHFSGSLQQLNIWQSQLADKEWIMFYFSTFKNLKRISFNNCQNQVDEELVLSFFKDTNTKIEQFYFANFISGKLRKTTQLDNFRQSTNERRTKCIRNKAVKHMLKVFPNLKNLWIEDLYQYDQTQFSQSMLQQVIKPVNNLRYLTLGSLQNKIKKQSLRTQDWQLLLELQSMKTLHLININIQEPFLNEFIKQNITTLETLIFEGCTQVSDTMFLIFAEGNTLKQLMLTQCNGKSLTGTGLWMLAQCQTLVIKNTEFNQFQLLQINNMQNLKCLVLQSCSWVSDMLIDYICAIRNLEILSLYHTKVSSSCIQSIVSNLKNLRGLNIGRTQIKGPLFAEFAYLPSLSKLSIQKLHGSTSDDPRSQNGYLKVKDITLFTDNLLSIKQQQKITHLNIVDCHRLTNNIFKQEEYWKGVKFLVMRNNKNIDCLKKEELIRKGKIIVELTGGK